MDDTPSAPTCSRSAATATRWPSPSRTPGRSRSSAGSIASRGRVIREEAWYRSWPAQDLAQAAPGRGREDHGHRVREGPAAVSGGARRRHPAHQGRRSVSPAHVEWSHTAEPHRECRVPVQGARMCPGMARSRVRRRHPRRTERDAAGGGPGRPQVRRARALQSSARHPSASAALGGAGTGATTVPA